MHINKSTKKQLFNETCNFVIQHMIKHMYSMCQKPCLIIEDCLTISISSAVVTFGNLQSMLREEIRTVPKRWRNGINSAENMVWKIQIKTDRQTDRFQIRLIKQETYISLNAFPSLLSKGSDIRFDVDIVFCTTLI